MDPFVHFDGKTVVVAGGASGIGRETAARFAEYGADVAIVDLDVDGARETAGAIADEYTVDTAAFETDVSDYEACAESVTAVRDRFGGTDVLVNTVVARGPKHTAKPFAEKSPAEWTFEIGVTLTGVLNMTHCVLPGMLEQGSGVVLNTSSSAAQGLNPGRTVYAGVKAGIEAFSVTLAKEVGKDGVRVNVVAPGLVKTERSATWIEDNAERLQAAHSMPRVGRPRDPANTFVFLASDAAEWITGETLAVDGGFLRSTAHTRVGGE